MRNPASAVLGLLLCALLIIGCERPIFPDTYEEVVEAHTKLPGKIHYATGDPYGPFKLVAVITGTVNTAGAMEPARHLGGKPSVTWPATPGYYYEGYKYMSEFDTAFYIVRKIPAAP